MSGEAFYRSRSIQKASRVLWTTEGFVSSENTWLKYSACATWVKDLISLAALQLYCHPGYRRFWLSDWHNNHYFYSARACVAGLSARAVTIDLKSTTPYLKIYWFELWLIINFWCAEGCVGTTKRVPCTAFIYKLRCCGGIEGYKLLGMRAYWSI